MVKESLERPLSRLNQISEHVFWLPSDSTTDRPVLGALVGKEGALIVDAGNSPAHVSLFLDEYSKRRLPSPRYLALTHWHWDHVFGAHAFNLLTFASLETRRAVQKMATLDWSDEALEQRIAEGTEIEFCRDMMKLELPDRSGLIIKPPDIGFSGQIELDLGGTTCRLIQVGGDHSSDSIVVYTPQDKIMFLGDCLYPDLYSGERSFTTHKLFQLIDCLLSYDVEYYLEAHALPASRQEMLQYTDLFKCIGRIVEHAGAHRPAALKALQEKLGDPLTAEQTAIMDVFLAGLRKALAAEDAEGFC